VGSSTRSWRTTGIDGIIRAQDLHKSLQELSCLHAHRFGVEHPVEAISIYTPKASLRAPPE
jgi:hypothetical protein